MFILPVYSDSVPFLLPPPSVSELKIFPPNSTAYLLSVYFCMRQQITGLLKMKRKSCRVGWGGVGDGEEGEVKEQEYRWHLLSSQCVHLAVLNQLPAFCVSLKWSLLWRRVMLCTLGFLHHVHCALLKLAAEKPLSLDHVERLETPTGPSRWEFIYANASALGWRARTLRYLEIPEKATRLKKLGPGEQVGVYPREEIGGVWVKKSQVVQAGAEVNSSCGLVKRAAGGMSGTPTSLLSCLRSWGEVLNVSLFSRLHHDTKGSMHR